MNRPLVAATINGQPGALWYDGESGRLHSVITLDIVDGHVQGVLMVLNPEKPGNVSDSDGYSASETRA